MSNEGYHSIRKDVNKLHTVHPLEMITEAMEKAMCFNLTSMFNPCEDCILGKAKEVRVSKMAVACSTMKR